MARIWQAGGGAISVQVLQELFVTLTNRAKMAMDPVEAHDLIRDLGTWEVFSPAIDDVLAAIDGAARWQVSFWDSMILVAANASGASVLWSEDLNDGQVYDEVAVHNPFMSDATA